MSIIWNRSGTIVTLFYTNEGILTETDRLPVLRLPVLVYLYWYFVLHAMLQSTLHRGYLWTKQIVHQLTNRTSWTIALLLTLLFAKVFTKFFTYCEVRIFIILVTTIRHWTPPLLWNNLIQSTTLIPLFFHFNSILYYPRRSPKTIVLQVLRQNICMQFLCPLSLRGVAPVSRRIYQTFGMQAATCR